MMNLTDKHKYQLLLEISQKVRDTLDLDETMNHLLDTVKTVVDYDAAGIFILNQDLVHKRHEQPKGKIAGIAHRGYDHIQNGQDDMLRFGKGITGHVISTNTSMIVPDTRLDERYVKARSQTLSEIAVPILRNKRAIGALNLESNQLSAYDESDLEVLQFIADAAAISIEKAMLHQQLLEKGLLDKQLQIARDMQSQLFPDKSPHIPGYDIAGICLPAEEIGGDYFDYIKLPRRELGVAVADISGNGIASALMMTAFRGLLRMHTRGRLGSVKIAQAINRLLPEFSGYSHFVALAYVVLAPDNNVFTYTCCGQQPPLLLHADGSVENLEEHGPALGILNDVNFTNEKKSMSTGDILLLYTDGVVELTNLAGMEYGMQRLVSVVNQARDIPSAKLIQKVTQATQHFSGTPNYQDDFTLVIIKRI
ncbi:MAG: SpoIIE family protein phosphatase [Anaerolineaceae bacterium]|nr:SpoIIE family protein phosphatase [Anaerolineaceae bacterium]